MKTFLKKLYIIGFMVLTVIFSFIIWKVTFGHIVDEYEYRKQVTEIKERTLRDDRGVEETTFKKAILESEERVKHYLGYRVLEEMRVEGHFHHIDYDLVADKRRSRIGGIAQLVFCDRLVTGRVGPDLKI